MIHHVFANKSNIGDWLSARAIHSLLAPSAVREYLCDEPFVAETLQRLEMVPPDEMIVIGGGGLFMDYFMPFWNGFQQIADRGNFCIWGVGCCDMKREDSRPSTSILRGIARKSRLCAVRDGLTRDFLGSEISATIVPCPSMNSVPILPPGNGVLHVDAYDNTGPEVYEIMESTGRAFADQTGRSFRSINNLIPAGNEHAFASILGLYKGADLILTGRLHGCIIGLAMGRKVLAVSGDYKLESFMNAAGLSDWVLDLTDIGSLPVRLRDLPDQETPYAFIEEARRNNHGVADRINAPVEQSSRL